MSACLRRATAVWVRLPCRVPGLLLHPPRASRLRVRWLFRSCGGSIHNIWSRLPQSLVREGLSTNWNRIRNKAKRFFTGKWSPTETAAQPDRKEIKKNETHNTKLNNELNAQTDWNAIGKDLKDQGISINIYKLKREL